MRNIICREGLGFRVYYTALRPALACSLLLNPTGRVDLQSITCSPKHGANSVCEGGAGGSRTQNDCHGCPLYPSPKDPAARAWTAKRGPPHCRRRGGGTDTPSHAAARAAGGWRGCFGREAAHNLAALGGRGHAVTRCTHLHSHRPPGNIAQRSWGVGREGRKFALGERGRRGTQSSLSHGSSACAGTSAALAPSSGF